MGEDSLHVGEMFAGVGGFRLGLEGPPSKDWETEFLKFEETGFKVVWSNQWEPGSSKQWASTIYTERFGEEGHDGDDLHNFTKNVEATHQIPQLDLLVGGFPCQDYSVARTISGELGIQGEKGKLWTPIWRIIRRSHANGAQQRPKMVLLENVPRLLNSPADARGLNFAVIINRLLSLAYDVEWRVIHADDYGFPQQRSRVFIIAYRNEGMADTRDRLTINGPGRYGAPRKRLNQMEHWIFGEHSGSTRKDWEVGPFAQAFPAKFDDFKEMELPDIDYWSKKKSPFGSAGYAWNARRGKDRRYVKLFRSWKAIPIKEEPRTIRDIMVQKGDSDYDESYEVDKAELKKWKYEKGEKREFRIRKTDLEKHPELAELYAKCKKSKNQKVWNEHRADFEKILGADGSYNYDEGAIAFPDSIDKPSRTVVTAEIGKSASRMRHLIKHDDGTYRTLFPIETERLNMFPDNWTKMNDEKGKQIPDSKRGFMMGNALVVGIIQRLREPLRKLILNRQV
jgi:DNA (cytosine-5)-methyltransferase 1